MHDMKVKDTLEELKILQIVKIFGKFDALVIVK
jgi:hypothetical protein